MSTPKPTLLILHGAWHHPIHFAPLTSLLQAHGYEVLCPIQPSYNAHPATTTLQDDAVFIKDLLSKLVEEDKEVVLMVHSYGGMVGTEAVTEELSARYREKRSLKGGVVSLLYLCAFLLHKGESLASLLGGALPPFIPVEQDGTCNMLEPAQRFYNDLAPALQTHYTALLKPHPASAQTTALTNEAYRYVATTYLLCENDQALPIHVQEELVRNAGVEIRTERCASGHSPFLSMPERVVEVVDGLKW